MAGGRDERVDDLFFGDKTADGNPAEEGLVRRVSNDLVVYINGTVKSLTSGTGGSDAKDVKVSANDTVPGFLEDKVVGGNLITVTTLNDGSDEDVQIAVDNHAATHQNGGADEINVGGLSGLLADAQTPLAHATTHSAGGTDEVDAGNLASDSAPAADYFLVSDGADGLVWQLAPVPGFGTGLNTVEDDTMSSTTSSTYQNKLNLTTGNLAAGDYMLFSEATVSGSLGGTRLEARIVLDGDTVSPVKEILVKPNVADGEVIITSHKPLQGLSGIHNIDIDYRKEGGSGSAQIRDCRITIWRIV